MPQPKTARCRCTYIEHGIHDTDCRENPNPIRECDWCGERFKPLHSDMKHCSQQCYYYENGPGEWFPPVGS